MDVVAKLRYFRVSPRKVRLVLGLIRGQHVLMAEQQLMNLPKRSSLPLLKLVKSAQANAEHNFKLDPKELFVKQAFADEGPKLKRYTPRAMGRATPVLKRMSHVTIVLAPISERGKKKPMGTKTAQMVPMQHSHNQKQATKVAPIPKKPVHEKPKAKKPIVSLKEHKK
jgi:large subunit ribosomal protein L22